VHDATGLLGSEDAKKVSITVEGRRLIITLIGVELRSHVQAAIDSATAPWL
jgi:hypothetical protein